MGVAKMAVISPEPKSSVLFNGFERVLISILATLLSGIAVAAMTEFGAPRSVDANGALSLMDRVRLFIDKWVPFVDNLKAFFMLGFVVVAPIVILVVVGRKPRSVVIVLTWLTALYLCVILCFTPVWVYHAHETFLSATQPLAMRFSGMAGAAEIHVLLAPYVLALLLIGGTGEFAYVVLQRELRHSWRMAKAMGVEEEERASRRERLVVTAMGSPMPVPLTLGRFLALLVIPTIAVAAITQLYSWAESMEKILPATSLVAATSRADPSTLTIYIDATGSATINGFPERTGQSVPLLKMEDLVSFLKSVKLEERNVLLQVDPNVRHERLVDVLNAASVAGAPVMLAE